MLKRAWCSPDRNSHQRRSPGVCPHGGHAEQHGRAVKIPKHGLRYWCWHHSGRVASVRILVVKTKLWLVQQGVFNAKTACHSTRTSGACVYYIIIIIIMICTQRIQHPPPSAPSVTGAGGCVVPLFYNQHDSALRRELIFVFTAWT